MCQDGIPAILQRLDGLDTCQIRDQGRPILDGFGEPGEKGSTLPRLSGARCSACGGRVPIVLRSLSSEGFNLPDAAVYQRLRYDSPVIAVGCVADEDCVARRCVTKSATTVRRWEPSESVRSRWQGMLWHVYQVAFVDHAHGRIGDFAPAATWGRGDPPGQLPVLAAAIDQVLTEARQRSTIAVRRSSRDTEDTIEVLLTPVMAAHGYRLRGRHLTVMGFWQGPQPDFTWQHVTGHTVSFEAKVTEDWEHPVCQPLANLLEHNAMVNIRVPAEPDQLTRMTRSIVDRAEQMLVATSRAAFLTIR